LKAAIYDPPVARRIIYALIFTGLAVSGCGGSDTADTDSSDRALITATVQRYNDAINRKDWTTACVTRTVQDRAAMARLAGSCEKAFASIFEKSPPLPKQEVFDLRVRGDQATYRTKPVAAAVDRSSPLQDQLLALKQDGEWRLQQPLK
jgi:hypothetical protein